MEEPEPCTMCKKVECECDDQYEQGRVHEY